MMRPNKDQVPEHLDLTPQMGDFHRDYTNNSKGLSWELELTHYLCRDIQPESSGTQHYLVTIFQGFLEATLIWLVGFFRLEETLVCLAALSEVTKLDLIQISSGTRITGLVCNPSNLGWDIQTQMNSIRLLNPTFSNQKAGTTSTQPSQVCQDQTEIPSEVVLIPTNLCD